MKGSLGNDEASFSYTRMGGAVHCGWREVKGGNREDYGVMSRTREAWEGCSGQLQLSNGVRCGHRKTEHVEAAEI